VKRISLIMNF